MLAGTPATAAGEGQGTPEALLAAIERAEPLDAAKLHAVFGADLRCAADDCERGPVTLRGLTIGHLDFRHGGFGSLLVLQGFPGQCLSLDRLTTLYPAGTITQGCTDGVLCFYYVARRPGERC